MEASMDVSVCDLPFFTVEAAVLENRSAPIEFLYLLEVDLVFIQVDFSLGAIPVI